MAMHGSHKAEIRERIQVSVLIDRLQKHVDGKLELSTTQVAAANSLLDRSLAKLQQIQHTGENNGPIKVQFSL
jgi:hypothetical protein